MLSLKEEESGDHDQEESDRNTQKGGEYQFMVDGEHDRNEIQTLAAATEEQMDSMEAWDHSKEDTMNEEEAQEGLSICIHPSQ